MSRRRRRDLTPPRSIQLAIVGVATVAVGALSVYAVVREPEPPPGGASYVAPTSPTPTPAPPAWAGADINVDFATRSDGPPGNAAPGVPFVLNAGVSGGGAATPIVRDGRLTMVSGGPAASYTQAAPDWKPREIGASFVFSAGDQDGAVCLALWDRLIPDPYAVPDSPMHLVVTPDRWLYGLWQAGKFEQIADGVLSEPLRTDGTTTYTTSASVRGDTTTITLPDGSTETVTDPRIRSIPGNVLNWEVYLKRGDAKGAFDHVWAGRNPRP